MTTVTVVGMRARRGSVTTPVAVILLGTCRVRIRTTVARIRMTVAIGVARSVTVVPLRTRRVRVTMTVARIRMNFAVVGVQHGSKTTVVVVGVQHRSRITVALIPFRPHRVRTTTLAAIGRARHGATTVAKVVTGEQRRHGRTRTTEAGVGGSDHTCRDVAVVRARTRYLRVK